jgi:hypothetical protein
MQHWLLLKNQALNNLWACPLFLPSLPFAWSLGLSCKLLFAPVVAAA